MSPPPLQLSTAPDLVEQIYARLLDAISEGTLTPGERLTQDGFVEDAPGRDVQVRQLDVKWTAQV